jgi:LPXTG-motif cell wall-anchored protein
MAALAIGTVGALAFAAPSSASTNTFCDVPKAPEINSLAKADAQEKVDQFLPQFGKCLEIVWTDTCDGNTLVSMTNWVKNDNDWTVLTVELLGKEYTLEGGSTPNTETVTIGPKVKDVQAFLVFTGEHNGTTWRIEVPWGETHTWVDPGAVCPSPSPTSSVTAAPTSAPATTTTAPPVAVSHDLPVTGASLTLPLATGVTALAVAGIVGFVLYRRRRASESL